MCMELSCGWGANVLLGYLLGNAFQFLRRQFLWAVILRTVFLPLEAQTAN